MREVYNAARALARRHVRDGNLPRAAAEEAAAVWLPHQPELAAQLLDEIESENTSLTTTEREA